MRARAYISMAAMVDAVARSPMVLERYVAESPDQVGQQTSVLRLEPAINVIDLSKEALTREEFVERVAKLAGSLYDAAKEL